MMNISWFSYRGLSPHKFTPMPGVHKSIKPTPKSGAAYGPRYPFFLPVIIKVEG
jgi:hypothetical protein